MAMAKRRNYRWAMRKLLLPVYGKGLVVDIGSGGRPHPFADVIVEKFIDNGHRYRELTADGRLVLADAACLPFRDKTFSFSMAFHVLEHVSHPGVFLSELGRISAAGYIETPNEIFEILNPISIHVNIVTKVDGALLIQRKCDNWMETPAAKMRPMQRSAALMRDYNKRPEHYHTRYRWATTPSFSLSQEEREVPTWFSESLSLTDDEVQSHGSVGESKTPSIIESLARVVRMRRARPLDTLVVCPKCKSDLTLNGEFYICTKMTCRGRYPASPTPDFRI